MRRPASVVTLILLTWLPGAAAAQREQLQPSKPPADAVTVNISGKVGGKSIQAAGLGACQHASEASIRGASASLWLVQFSGQHDRLKQLNLTLWRLKDGGPDQVSLTLETKSGTHRVESGGTGEDQGEATVVILPNGPGGRLEITGKDAEGKQMQIAVECPAFAGVEAEGG